MSPIPLVDFRHASKDELPFPKPSPDFRTPVLSLVGSNDEIVDWEAAQESAALYGKQEAVQLPDTAHDLMLVSYSATVMHEHAIFQPQCMLFIPT